MSPVPTCYQQDSTELNHAIQGKDCLDEFGGRVQKGEGPAISDYLSVKLSHRELKVLVTGHAGNCMSS